MAAIAFPFHNLEFLKTNTMTAIKHFDVIIVGGSYSGLAAAMALGRALRKVLVIDSAKPCNRNTPHSHNFLTQDGKTPGEIAALAKQQVAKYNTVEFFNGLVTSGRKIDTGFEIQTLTKDQFSASRLVFATGIKDLMPDIAGFEECWGISILHCPYCHGYEVKNEITGVLGNGEYGFEFSNLITNWTKDLTLFTNGKSTLTIEQTDLLKKNKIKIIEKEIEKFEHSKGYIQNIVHKDGSKTNLNAIYTKVPFKQNSLIPKQLGCEITQEGYIKIDQYQKTSVSNIYACGDNSSYMRTLANAVSMGTTTGMMLNKEFVLERIKEI